VVVLRDVPEDPSRNGLGAEEQVLLGIEYGDLGRAMSQLSPEMRAVMQATVLDGLTTREAARLLGIPQNTVKTRLHRAKAQLRVSLTEEGRT
jgi:RNA polymerase sigma-70 factor (ECF subfamily)